MQLVVTKSNTLNAFSWIKQGWRLFTLQPGAFMGMSAIILFATLLANMIPVLGIFLVFLAPFLSAGFYRAASIAEQGERLTVTDVFALLSEIGKYRVLIRLAGISLLLSIPMTMVADEIRVALEAGGVVTPQTLLFLIGLIAINFMLLAFAIPAAWVSPETPALELIKQSFQACWINIFPLALYGLIIAAISIITFPIVLVGWLIAYAIGVLSFYQMFMTIYQPRQQPEVVVEDAAEQDDQQKEQDESKDSD
jgi:uncharacterized membrane protein